jgi:hypothetical protein
MEKLIISVGRLSRLTGVIGRSGGFRWCISVMLDRFTLLRFSSQPFLRYFPCPPTFVKSHPLLEFRIFIFPSHHSGSAALHRSTRSPLRRSILGRQMALQSMAHRLPRFTLHHRPLSCHVWPHTASKIPRHLLRCHGRSM